jgi:serine/threonine protein kinase
MIGKTLGNFEITGQLGKGGMGEVYRARDTKLNRDVALKILPAEFANDSERMARFKREAQLLASLNHPNIASIYGLEESGGMRALIMELAEGPTLAELILKGPIPLDETLGIARQITEALEAAHEKGIIHRDLKPANIKITPEGIVKVLDFGLAKALEGQASIADASESPTLSLTATQAGVILGTAAYMAPEQARGSIIDKRCDIWSFGVVLFEMLTGKQLFAGETVSDTLAAVLRADVDWNLLPANTPASIQTLLHRCLTKDRKERMRDIGEARIAIAEYLANPSSVSFQETALGTGRRKLREKLAWVAVILLVAALTALGIVYYRKISEPSQVTRFEYTLPEDQRFRSYANEPFLAVSPKGNRFTYSTNKGLYVRFLDKWEAELLVEANEKPSNPFFSPDGEWVAYRSIAENKLKKISVNGGVPTTLCDVGTFFGAFWAADDTIIYCEFSKAIMQVSANVGNPKVLFKEDAAYYHHPQLLPDGKSLLFSFGTSYPYSIATWSPGSPKAKPLIPAGDRPFYLPTGHLVYALTNKLYAASFDPSKLEPSGASARVVDGIFRPEFGASPQYDVSPSGTLIYVQTISAGDLPKRTLVWVTRDGREEPIDIPPQAYNDWSPPKISPDGMWIALTIDNRNGTNIWMKNLFRKGPITPLTNGENENSWPVWDGKKIIYRSSRDGNIDIYDIKRKAADGSGDVEILGSPPVKPGPFSLSKDGRTLLSWDITYSPHQTIISMLSLESGLVRKPLLQSKSYEQHPVISPNGQWLAYASDETTRNEVYVRPFPDVNKGGGGIVSTNGGYGPLWSPNGRELFYRDGDSVMAVEVKTEPAFKIVKEAKEIFRGTYFSPETGSAKSAMWDISSDGKRFVMIKETESSASTAGGPRKICVILNWFEELKKTVPVK